MVFSKFLSNFKDLLTPSDDEKINFVEHNNKKAVSELKQGMVFLRNKQKTINKLQNRLKLIENMTTEEKLARSKDKLTQVNENEKAELSLLEEKFNQQLSNYSTEYTNFMTTYYQAIDAINACKTACESDNTADSTAGTNKKEACKAGCTLQSPYIQDCRDTFKRSKIGNKNCNEITSGKCLSGEVLAGAQMVTDGEYADANGVLIKDGCCECGGGAGGPPTVNINAKTVKKCEELPKAFGYTGNNGNYTIAACNSARVNYASPQRVANLRNVYANLKDSNAQLIKTSNIIFNKIKKLNNSKTGIKSKIGDIDKQLQTQMGDFSSIYADIMERRGIKEKTVEAQLEDIRLKESSSTLQYLIWSGLAILSILIVIERMRK